MKNYSGKYTTQEGEETVLKVSFTSNYNFGNNALKVKVEDFTVSFGTSSYKIEPLIKGDKHSEDLLKETLSVDNPEVANYGDGHHHEKVQRKIDLWGTRDGAMRCYIPQDEDNSGYFNTGTSLIKTQFHGIPLESGILKSSTGSTDVMITTGIAIRCLMHDLYHETKDLQGERGALTSNRGIYTVNPDNHTTITILEGCGYKKSINNTGLQRDITSSSERFEYTDGKLLEGENRLEKLLYSCDYGELPVNMTLVGEESGSNTEYLGFSE